MTIDELKEIVKDATQQAFDGQRISPDEKGMTWAIISGERLWFRTLLDSVEVESIKHAHVIVDEDGNIKCSSCGSSNCFDNYCGNCGARMGKEDEE